MQHCMNEAPSCQTNSPLSMEYIIETYDLSAMSHDVASISVRSS